jgi:hypothetical protein
MRASRLEQELSLLNAEVPHLALPDADLLVLIEFGKDAGRTE